MLTAGSIYPEELTIDYNKDVELTRQRAVEFFGKLWKELPVPPTKKILTYRQYGEMPVQIMKGMVNDREHFLLFRCQTISTNPRYIRDYSTWDRLLRDGTETVISIAEKLSGPHIELIVAGASISTLLNSTGQLSPGRMTQLLEQEIVLAHSFDDETTQVMRLSHNIPVLKKTT